MLRYKVCLSNDITVGSIAGLTSHGLVVPPAPEVPAAPCIDLPAPSFWPPGSCLGQNKLTRRVTHRRAAIVQDGHDVGAAIPHVSIPASNVLTPIQVLFSKRKTIFFEPRVRFEQRFAAPCSAFATLPTPMMSCCDPFSMPVGSSVTDQWNTVEFGMSLVSYAVSYAAMAATMLLDACSKRGARPSTEPFPMEKVLERWGKDLWSKAAGGSKAKDALGKLGLEAGLGLGKLFIPSGDRTVSLPMPGGPFLRLSGTVDESGGSAKGTLLGLSTDGSNAWTETWGRGGHDGPWGADLG
jgi:hypothetical protein